MILSAGNMEQFSFATPIGVGLIDSALTLSKVDISSIKDRVRFIGSAGSYDKNIPLMSLITAKNSSNVEISYLEKKSYTPITNIIINEDEKKLADVPRETIENSMVINSSNYITSSDESRAKFFDMGFKLENMEFYSVVKWAVRNKIDFEGVFVVTNYCYENAHEEFMKNYKESKNMLEKYLKTDGLI